MTTVRSSTVVSHDFLTVL